MDTDDRLDEEIDKTIKTKCIKGHKFNVQREKIQTSSTGKSFVTLCPKCNGVARLRKNEVYELFGVNPRDHVAVGKLYESLAIGNTPIQGQTSSMPPTVNGSIDGSPVVTTEKDSGDEDADEETDADFEDDEDDEDEEEIDANPDDEYTAVVEEAHDVTGKGKPIRRFRVLDEDTDDEDEEDIDQTVKTPVKIPKKPNKPDRPDIPDIPVQKSRRQVDYDGEDDEMEDDVETHRRNSRKRDRIRARTVVEDDYKFDPNDVLKDLIEESGLDENTLGRIFDYIDMQPDGWQPAGVQGVLQMYLSPASAQKIATRYQAEIYKEEKRRERERSMMNLVGNPSGNMRLFQNDPGMNFSPINTPLRNPGGYNRMNPQYNPNMGFDGGYMSNNGDMFPPQASQMQYRVPPPPPAARGLSSFEVERMIDAKLDGVVDRLAKAMEGSKREDIIAQEAKEMRMMVMEMLKNNAVRSAPVESETRSGFDTVDAKSIQHGKHVDDASAYHKTARPDGKPGNEGSTSGTSIKKTDQRTTPSDNIRRIIAENPASTTSELISNLRKLSLKINRMVALSHGILQGKD